MSKKNCPYEVYVSAYLDNELSPSDKQLLQNHLDYCSNCRRVAEDIIAVGKYTASCRQKFALPDISALVLQKINQPVKIFTPVWQRYFYKLGLAVAMLFFVLRTNDFSQLEVAIFTGYVLGHLIIYTDNLLKTEKFFNQLNLCSE